MWWPAHNPTRASAGSERHLPPARRSPSTPNLRGKVATASTRGRRLCRGHRRPRPHQGRQQPHRRTMCGAACFTREATSRRVGLVRTSLTGRSPTHLLSMTGCIATRQNRTTVDRWNWEFGAV